HRIEAPVGRRCGDAEGYALVRASDRAAVGRDEPRLVLDRALRGVDAREGLNLGEDAGRERRRRVALGARTDRRLRADHGVGGLVRLVEDAVEALAERVGKHERAADHRDAEHDCEGGQCGPQLASEQPLDRDPDHADVTSWSVSRISWAVYEPMALTIRPSARNT